MQVQEKIQNFHPAIAEFGHPANIAFIPQVNLQTNLSISIGSDVRTTDVHTAQVQALTSLTEQLAIWLAGALNVLRTYNEPAIYPIMSILEPYMEETPEVDFSFPPKSSQDVTIKVTNRGRVTPTISIGDTL